MLPSGWIFYQSVHFQQSRHDSWAMTPWNLSFDNQFECSNILVSHSELRQSACALLATEKSAIFHFDLDSERQTLGLRVVCGQGEQGYLFLIFDQLNCAKKADVMGYVSQSILPYVHQQSARKSPSQRTKTVVRLTALGFTTTEIANALFLSNRGVDYHLDLAKKHLGASNRSALIFLAMQQDWFT
ncbi:LuxR C-terminal-related transcriptional regulator [Ferrimonas aestuarii]|uniref:Response regulator transcription factor n=1 Tax=Ferrimonas aestuarii TaxID=2569539 RepID=A0A4U1BIM2_9GAMM|nr:LuxR C-terminal-related transcriptional regulator [Ferrimonas aestuarii]TKB50959.1 response regulator transcription factor [Ferrimonas aestuarii]